MLDRGPPATGAAGSGLNLRRGPAEAFSIATAPASSSSSTLDAPVVQALRPPGRSARSSHCGRRYGQHGRREIALRRTRRGLSATLQAAGSRIAGAVRICVLTPALSMEQDDPGAPSRQANWSRVGRQRVEVHPVGLVEQQQRGSLAAAQQAYAPAHTPF